VLTFAPSDDATIKKDTASTNDGAGAAVAGDLSPVRNGLLNFTVTGTAGQPIKSARLRLHVSNASPKGGVLYPVADTTWTEGAVTWANAPASGSTAVATVGAVNLGQWIDVDVSSHVKAEGTYSLRLKGGSTDGVGYTSKEAAANRPQLVVTY